jgi:hypothetical protein
VASQLKRKDDTPLGGKGAPKSGSKTHLMLKPITNFLSNFKTEDANRPKVPPSLDPCLLLYTRGIKLMEEKTKKIKDKEEL